MKPENSIRSSGKPASTQTKKPYRKPKLRVYGDLASIVKNVTGTKLNDGAGHPNKHFTS